MAVPFESGQGQKWQDANAAEGQGSERSLLQETPYSSRQDYQSSRNDAQEHGDRMLREPPSSQVGYGGGDREAELLKNFGDGGYHIGEESGVRRDDNHDGRFVDNTSKADNSKYGFVDPNTAPSDAGRGSSTPGGYRGEGDYYAPSESEAGNMGGRIEQRSSAYGAVDANTRSVQSEVERGGQTPGKHSEQGDVGRSCDVEDVHVPLSQDGGDGLALGQRVPVTHKSKHFGEDNQYGHLLDQTRSPGTVLFDENHFGPKYGHDGELPSAVAAGGHNSRPNVSDSNTASLQELEVRDGVAHGVVDGFPSGAGQQMDDESGIQGEESQQYNQTGPLRVHENFACNRESTEPDASDSPAQVDKSYSYDNHPSAAAHEGSHANLQQDPHKATTTEETRHDEGLMAKIKLHLPGHKKDGHETHATASTTSESEHEKPTFMERIKDKLSPGHHKSADVE